MDQAGPLLRNVSDTARWAAMYRARESERPDALFRDPFARRLAGERGERIYATMPGRDQSEWAWVTRTHLFDRFITDQVAKGADLVVNLAAGLDARPYRLPLPASLRWVEVDLPAILDDKESALRGEAPACRLERVRLDLADVTARRALFESLGRTARRALVITEGLLIYLPPDGVAALARDLAVPASFQDWVLEVVSPGLLRMMQRKLGRQLDTARAPFLFGPPEGPGFFVPHGWRPAEVRSMLQTARGLGRLSLMMRLLSLLPESNDRQGSRPWSGVCLLTRGGT